MSGETEAAPSGWTTDTLLAYFLKQHEDLKLLLNERFATQTSALDRAFLVQETAMQTALAAADRANTLALLSAEKAVTKSEIAADKRFASVNEFRQTLTDQAATFMSRNEADARLQALDEKLSTEATRTGTRINELELRVTSRLDIIQGTALGNGQQSESRRREIAQLISVISVVLLFISVATAIVISTR